MKFRNALIVALAAVGIPAAVSNAALTLDVRLAGGGKSVSVTTAGTVINLEVYGLLPNANAGADTITTASMGFVSTGTTLGNYTSAITASGFDGTGHQDTNGPTLITPNDRDGDTDLDIGGASAAAVANWFAARAGSAVAGTEILLGTMTWQVGTLGSVGSTTNLNALVRVSGSAASFVEDGAARNGNAGNIVAGAPVVVTIASATAVPEPATLGLVASAAAMLLGRRRRQA